MAAFKLRLQLLEFFSAKLLSVRTQIGCPLKAKHFFYAAKKEAIKLNNAIVSSDTKYNAI